MAAFPSDPSSRRFSASAWYSWKQYRYPIEGRYWEFPQGSWETGDLAPEALARAELEEETGYTAREVRHLGHLFAAYGYSNQGYDVFVATKRSPAVQNHDPRRHDTGCLDHRGLRPAATARAGLSRRNEEEGRREEEYKNPFLSSPVFFVAAKRPMFKNCVGSPKIKHWRLAAQRRRWQIE